MNCSNKMFISIVWKAKNEFKTCNQFHNILRFLDAFSFTTNVTMEIITYKHGIYKLPHELPKDLRLRILSHLGFAHGIIADGQAWVPTQEKKRLRILGNIRKVSKLHRILAQSSVSLPKWNCS